MKVAIDRYARSQEDFEKRLGRARKTMIYRAHVRNSQLEASVASQIVARITRQSSLALDSKPAPATEPKSSFNSTTEDPLPRRINSEVPRTRSVHRTSGTRRTKPKKVSTNTLFAIVIFDEFLKELASLAHEHAAVNLIESRTTSL